MANTAGKWQLHWNYFNIILFKQNASHSTDSVHTLIEQPDITLMQQS